MDKTQEQLQKAKYGGLVPKKKLLPKVHFAYQHGRTPLGHSIKKATQEVGQKS